MTVKTLRTRLLSASLLLVPFVAGSLAAQEAPDWLEGS